MGLGAHGLRVTSQTAVWCDCKSVLSVFIVARSLQAFPSSFQIFLNTVSTLILYPRLMILMSGLREFVCAFCFSWFSPSVSCLPGCGFICVGDVTFKKKRLWKYLRSKRDLFF